MIQRVQSLYLLIVGISAFTLYFFPFQKNIVNFSEIVYLKLDLFNYTNNFIFVSSILNLIILTGAITIIFLYRNRIVQRVMCYYLAVLNVILLSLMYYGASTIKGIPTYQFPFFIPVLNAVLSIVAAYYIKRDENIIKSADRIR